MATTLQQTSATTVIAATSTTTAAPTGATNGYVSNADGGGLRTALDYTGTVTGTLRMYVKIGSTWYRGDSFAMTGTDEAVDWNAGEGAEVYWTVEAISGGGTVKVDAVGVQS